MNINFYWDSDGVLAKWEQVPVEMTHLPGHFQNKKPEMNAVRAVRQMKDRELNVSILTSTYVDGHSQQDKDIWYGNNKLGRIKKVFVPYGQQKADFVMSDKGDVNLLIDDYTKNLREWETYGPGFVAVKFMNGINGTKGTWNGHRVSRDMSPEELVSALMMIAQTEAAKRAAFVG